MAIKLHRMQYLCAFKATHCRVLCELLTIVDNDWRKCINVKQYTHLMMTKANAAKFYTYSLWIFNVFAGMLYFGTDNLIALISITMDHNVTLRPFPVKMIFPFEAEQSPIYELTVIVTFLHAMSLVCFVNFLSGLILTLVLHVSGQIEIMCQEFKIFPKKVLRYGSHEHTIKMIVKKHCRVILFCKNLDKLFSYISLMQSFCYTVVICFVGVAFLTSDDEIDNGWMKTSFAYIGILLEVLVICYIGEYLAIKNKSLGDAAYESLWYKMPRTYCRDLLFIIMRSQKDVTITFGGITKLSMRIFTSIIRASLSYMSVFKAMY